MKNLVSFLLMVICGICLNTPLYAQEQAKKKVAVYMTGTTTDGALKKVIGAKLVNAITESEEYAAVERTADFLAALSAESDYQTSGEVRDSQIARLGQKFGVRYVVVADASELFDECFIAARLINVETGLVERSFDVNGPAESMAQLIDLSKSVAEGLISNLPSIKAQAKPAAFTLCAIKDSKLVFISAKDWEKLSDEQKGQYQKIGLCLQYKKNDNEYADGYFVMGLTDRVSLPRQYAAQFHSGTVKQYFSIIYNGIDKVNGLLKYFGGEELSTGYYWPNDDSSWGIDLYRKIGETVNATDWNPMRACYTIQEIYDLNPKLSL